MNPSRLILILCLLLGAALHAQTPEESSTPKPARHTLMLRVGGSAVGIGPAYEYLAVAQPKFGVGVYVGISPLNASVYNYSPFMETAGVALMYGSKRWKAELDLEGSYYHEKGIIYGDFPPYSIPYVINDVYGAALVGLRRQAPWGGLFFKANAGAIFWRARSQSHAFPMGSLALGYTFGKTDWTRSMLLPGPGWQTRLALVGGLDRHFEHATEDPFAGHAWIPDFGSGPAAQAGVMLDVRGPASRWGMRFAVAGAATHVHYNYAQFRPDFYIPTTIQYKTDIKGIGGEFSMRGRYAIGDRKPWVVQAGWYVGMYIWQSQKEWSTFIPNWHERYNQMPPSTGPLLALSKQWTANRWVLEPFVEGRMAVRDDIGRPNGRTRTLRLGLIAWLPTKQSRTAP